MAALGESLLPTPPWQAGLAHDPKPQRRGHLGCGTLWWPVYEGRDGGRHSGYEDQGDRAAWVQGRALGVA